MCFVSHFAQSFIEFKPNFVNRFESHKKSFARNITFDKSLILYIDHHVYLIIIIIAMHAQFMKRFTGQTQNNIL